MSVVIIYTFILNGIQVRDTNAVILSRAFHSLSLSNNVVVQHIRNYHLTGGGF